MEAISLIRHPTAEETVVAGFLDEDTAIRLQKKVEPEDFESEIYQAIVEACNRLLRSPEPYDLENIADYTRRVLRESKKKATLPVDFLERLKAKDIRRAEAYCITVQRQSQYRKAHDFSTWVQDVLLGCPDPDELHSELVSRARGIVGTKSNVLERWTEGVDTISGYEMLLRETARARETGTIKEFPWPWQSWNERVEQLMPGMVGNIIAPTGVGKSVALEVIAEFWASLGLRVVFVHCENAKDYTLHRRMARWTGVPFRKLRMAELSAMDRNKVDAASQKLVPVAANLDYLNGAGLTMDELCAEIDQRKRDNEVDAVVLDYLQKVQFSRGTYRHNQNDEGREARNAELLHTCAVLNQVPIMTASQMKKDAQEKVTKTGADIRGSGQVLEKFQLNVTFSRPRLKQAKTDVVGNVVADVGQKDTKLIVSVDKQNQGAESQWDMVFVGHRFDIKDVPR